MEGTVIVTVTPATAEKETSSLVHDSTRSDTPVRPSRPRNVLLDFLRALCVLFVVAHHASLRLDGVYFTGRFKGYPLSNNLWVLWYLAIMSGMLFGLSSGRLLPYLKRLFVVLAFGCVANLLGIVISWSTNPDANNEISVEGVLYQMYFLRRYSLPARLPPHTACSAPCTLPMAAISVLLCCVHALDGCSLHTAAGTTWSSSACSAWFRIPHAKPASSPSGRTLRSRPSRASFAEFLW
jgi:hypothetical protein